MITNIYFYENFMVFYRNLNHIIHLMQMEQNDLS